MFVGVLRLTFRIPGARSLKDRRRVVRSFKDRVQSRLRVAVGEVGGLDEHQRCVLGVSVVARDASRCDELLAAAAEMAGVLRDAELVDRATELIAFGAEGAALRDGCGMDALETRPFESVHDDGWPPQGIDCRSRRDSRDGPTRRSEPRGQPDDAHEPGEDCAGDGCPGALDPSDPPLGA